MYNVKKTTDEGVKKMTRNHVLEVSNGNRFLLTADKYLVGNIESADIHIDIPNADGPFLLLVRDGDNYDIISLRKDIDITVNNRIIDHMEKAIVGKTITFCGLEIKVSPKEIKKHETLAELPPDLPGSLAQPAAQNTITDVTDESVELEKVDHGYELIDGEYCQIAFKDEYVEALDRHPFELIKQLDYPEELIDKEAKLDQDKEKKTYIEVVVMVRGSVVFIDQIDYQEGIYELAWGFPQKTPLLVFKDGKVEILTPHGFETQVIATKENTGYKETYLDGKIFSLFQSPTQIFVREVENSKKPKPYLFFEAEKEILKEAAYIALALFIPFLFLLFLDTTLPEKKKEDVAIVYKKLRKPIKPKPKVAKKKQTQDKPSAQKESKVADKPKGKKVQTKSNLKDVVTPQKTVTKVAKKTPKVALQNRKSVKRKVNPKVSTHKLNKTTKSNVNKVARKAPAKTYKLKLKSNFKSLFGNQKSASSVKVNNRGAVAAFASGQSSSSNKLTGLDSSVGSRKAVGAIGGNISGRAEGAYGAGGLGDKKGFYATLSRKRTVVMGSMDPELIRRLLREHLSQFRYCYQKEIANHNAAKNASVDLKFTIMPNGAVGNVDLAQRGSTFSTQGIRCVGSVLNLIDFPRPKGGGRVDVEQPLNFAFSKRNF